MKHTELASLTADTAGLPRATPLFRESGLRGLLLHLNAGEQIPEHQTKGAISVQCLTGEAVFSCGSEQVTLRPASLVSLPPGAPHSVKANSDTVLMVTISEQIPTDGA